MDFDYGVIAIKKDDQRRVPDIYHFVGFDTEPTQEMLDDLRVELATDPEFGLMEMIDSLELIMAPISVVDLYKQMMSLQEQADNDPY